MARLGQGGVIAVSERAVDLADLEAAGLYHPMDPHARSQLELLDLLLARGTTLEDLIAGRHDLPVLVFDLALKVGHEHLDSSEVAERSGVPADLIDAIWRASGLPDPDPGRRALNEVDVESMAMLHGADELLGRDTTLQLVRVMGAAMARIADAMVSAFIANVDIFPTATDPVGLSRAHANAAAADLLPATTRFLDLLLRRHLAIMRRPLDVVGPAAEGFAARHLAVGFADLVGSTSLAQGLSPAELGSAMSDFENSAADLATAHNGRLVKLIGDEVMFIASDAVAACDIALRLVEAVDAHPVLSPIRVGIASGEVLCRDGDYYGPVVNLAARIVKIAPPATVAVSDEVRAAVHAASPGTLYLQRLGTYELHGLPAPAELAHVSRTDPSQDRLGHRA
jgi:adenylate cyclase